MRALIAALNTYSGGGHNDGKLGLVAAQLDYLTVATGDVDTMWGRHGSDRSGAGFHVTVLPVRFSKRTATSSLTGLAHVAAQARPSVIHVECEPWQGLAIQSVRLARKLGVPVGIQFAENGPKLRGASGALRRWAAARCLSQCSYAVGWSSGSARVARELAPDLHTEVFPGTGNTPAVHLTDSDKWFGSGSAPLPKLAFVGRFSLEKGVDHFLEVCDALARRLPIRAALAGGEAEEVSRWVRDRPWATSHGILPRADVAALLTTADALVATSRTTPSVVEQFGKAPVEAMALGIPVFAYDCGALAEVIGVGGFVVPEGAIDELVGSLERYLRLPEVERVATRQAARVQAEQFSDQAIAQRLIELWSRTAVDSREGR